MPASAAIFSDPLTRSGSPAMTSTEIILLLAATALLLAPIGAPLLLSSTQDHAPLIQGITDVMPRAFGSSRLVCDEGCSVRR